MIITELENEIFFEKNILKDVSSILYSLNQNVVWDNSIKSRKTASFGIPYNYSNINYQMIKMPEFLDVFVDFISNKNGFIPNNCLINFYFENSSKMGFHSDQIDILNTKTGIAIFSFGASRILRFKNKINPEFTLDILLENNSYFYMTQKVQLEWLHSILPDKNKKTREQRFSLTFRKIKY